MVDHTQRGLEYLSFDKYWNWVPRSLERDDPPSFSEEQPQWGRFDHILPTDWSCQHMSARLRASMIGPPINQKKNTIYFNQQMEVNMKKARNLHFFHRLREHFFWILMYVLIQSTSKLTVDSKIYQGGGQGNNLNILTQGIKKTQFEMCGMGRGLMFGGVCAKQGRFACWDPLKDSVSWPLTGPQGQRIFLIGFWPQRPAQSWYRPSVNVSQCLKVVSP